MFGFPLLFVLSSAVSAMSVAKCFCHANTDRPQGVTMSGSHDVISGDRLTLTCKTTSSNPEAEITWYDARGRQLTTSVTSEFSATAVRVTRVR